jgi:MFS family permease
MAKGSHHRWLTFLVLASGYLLVYFHRLCPAVVAIDMMEDLGAGAGLMGLLASAYFYPYAAMQIPSGLLSDTWGPRKTITCFFVLAGFGSIVFGLAPNTAWAIGARVAVGLGVAMLFVPTMKILTRWFHATEFARMTGILVATGGVGALSAAMPLAFFSSVVGWRGSFVVVGFATLAMAVVIWVLVRNSPEERGLPPVDDGTATKGPRAVRIGTWQGLRMVAGSLRFWPMAIWFFFTAGIFLTFFGLWGGPYLMEVYGLGRIEAGAVLSMVAVAKIVGCPTISYLSDRWGTRRKFLLVAAVTQVVLMVPLAFFPAAFGFASLFVWAILFGVSGSAIVVVAFPTTKEMFPVEIAGTAVGLINLFPFLGAAIMQPVLGLILETQEKGPNGYDADAYGLAFQVFFYASLIALAAAFMIEETLRPEKA